MHTKKKLREPAVGELVSKREYLLSAAGQQFSAKLAPKYSGQYTVIEKISRKIFLIQDIDGTVQRVHKLGLSLKMYCT
ncbi:Protein of unknown function [Cotesia congregata]|uniref:Uncharacterized protein n=1 Tax=Cotesia congregata TaxID=51543 RepID=A0A8J2MC34_COTCN|nr:Protein of unknown function [Cotesia congregata]